MRCDELAAYLTASYELFLFALNGRYQQTRAPGVELSPRALRDLEVDAYALGRTFLTIVENGLEDHFRPLVDGATSAVQDALVQRKKEALALVRGMVIENVKQTVRTARTGMSGIAEMIKGAGPGVGALIQRLVGVIQLKVTDTSGRKWEPEKLMRVVLRDAAYQADIDAQIDTLRAGGHPLASVVWTAGGYIVRQEVVAIADAAPAEYRRFEDVRDELFHPNSTARLMPYVQT